MKYYHLIGGFSPSNEPGTPLVAVLSPEELKETGLPSDVPPKVGFPSENAALVEAAHLSSLHFSRVELLPGEELFGSLCVPKKSDEHHPHTTSYLLSAGRFVLVTVDALFSELLEKAFSGRDTSGYSIPRLFCEYLEALIENDLRYIETLEKRVSALEEAALDGRFDNFSRKLMVLRKKILRLFRYYAQLADLAETLAEQPLFEPEQKRLERFSNRAERLQNEVQVLSEYSMQVREVFQAQVDLRQNNIMRVLTVLTSVFMPLTLLTGWFGMNFQNMPELSWPFGYPLIILISIAILAFCIWLCRKKKFL